MDRPADGPGRERRTPPESGAESGASTGGSLPAGVPLSPTDVAFVVGVPLVLVAVFALPREVRVDLALSYTDPTPLTMYAAHFVHLELPHLLVNLFVFLAVVPIALLGSVRNGRRRRFYLVAFTILAVFPFVFSALNVLFPRPRIGMGFSGMNLAFVGFLPHVLADRLETQRPDLAIGDGALSALAFFLGTAVIAFRLARSAGSGLASGVGVEHLLSAGEGGFLAAGVASLAAVALFGRPALARLRSRETDAEPLSPLVPFGALLFVLLVVVGFPRISPAEGRIVNVFLHFLGYSFGYVVPHVTFQLLRVDFDPREAAVS